MHKEDGFVLPIMMVLIALLSSFFLFAVKEWSGWRKQDQMRLAMVQAGYAAESGIAYRQVMLKMQPNDYTTMHQKFDSYEVKVSVWESESGTLIIQSVARGSNNMKQTKTAEVTKDTLKIIRWLE